jgi:hypothetical protein
VFGIAVYIEHFSLIGNGASALHGGLGAQLPKKFPLLVFKSKRIAILADIGAINARLF